MKYFANCFILTLPILVWNLLLTNKLPKATQPGVIWSDMLPVLTLGENLSRIVVFLLTFLMPLHIVTPLQKKGLFIYVAGTLLYFASWLILIYFPASNWSKSIIGLMAPAFTPLFWLIGIGIIGDSFYFHLPYKRWFFIIASLIFLLFHNLNTFTTYFTFQ